MSVILLSHGADGPATDCVRAALWRSFTAGQVRHSCYGEFELSTAAADEIFCLLNPGDGEQGLLERLLKRNTKILIFGAMGESLAASVGLRAAPLGTIPDLEGLASAELTTDRPYDTSPGCLVYEPHPLLARLPLGQRPLVRYDFTDEWNSLGFGRIATDGGIWSLAQRVEAAGAAPLAQVWCGDTPVTAYAAIAAVADSAVLWFNRAVGPLDSLEWTIVETFCSDYRPGDLPCIPYLMEVPVGYTGVATMRLDCDQAIVTARPLAELYAERGVPLSLAVVTGLPPAQEDLTFLKQLLAQGGAVVSHSRTHPPNWGADYAQALGEAKESKAWLEQHLPELGPVHYAVSPFHQNPPYAVQALAAAGYLGFVAGVIHNDPEYLLARSGQVPHCEQPLVSHSQQCMLHGDCYHRYGDSIAPYRESFTNHFKAGVLFGYLDHPFSKAYQYGWDSEAERLSAHEQLLQFIQSHDGIWLPNLKQCLDFVYKRSLVSLSVRADQSLTVDRRSSAISLEDIPAVQVGWRGETRSISG